METTMYYYFDSTGRKLWTPNVDLARKRAKHYGTIEVTMVKKK